MFDPLIQRAERALQDACGLPFATLVAPVGDPPGAGQAIAGHAAASQIQEARRADDASLPTGAWQHDFKRADWHRVALVAAHWLAGHGKDLRAAAWLLEAQVHLSGFAALGGCIHLLDRLCERYWEDLHPLDPDGEARGDVFRWIDRQLTPALRLVPLARGRQGEAYALAEWDEARHAARETGAGRRLFHAGPGLDELEAALRTQAGDACAGMARDLADAQALLGRLAGTLGARMGAEAPSLAHVAAVLERAHAVVDAELRRRGPQPAPEHAALPATSDTPAAPEAPATAAATGAPAPRLAAGAACAMLHHISLGVRDLRAAGAFYDAALGALGWRRVFEDDEAIGYGVEDGEDALCLKQRPDAAPPGAGFHLAFAAPSREAVGRFHAAGLGAGGSGNGAPGPRPDYGPRYYAAFLVDPDGHRLEAVNKD